jgi:hypothetical protein
MQRGTDLVGSYWVVLWSGFLSRLGLEGDGGGSREEEEAIMRKGK